MNTTPIIVLLLLALALTQFLPPKSHDAFLIERSDRHDEE